MGKKMQPNTRDKIPNGKIPGKLAVKRVNKYLSNPRETQSRHRSRHMRSSLTNETKNEERKNSWTPDFPLFKQRSTGGSIPPAMSRRAATMMTTDLIDSIQQMHNSSDEYTDSDAEEEDEENMSSRGRAVSSSTTLRNICHVSLFAFILLLGPMCILLYSYESVIREETTRMDRR